MKTYSNIKTAVKLIRKVDGLIEDREWLITEVMESAESVDKKIQENIYKLQSVMESMSEEEYKVAQSGMFYEADDCNYYPLEKPSEYAIRILPEMKEGYSAYSIFPAAK